MKKNFILNNILKKFEGKAEIFFNLSMTSAIRILGVILRFIILLAIARKIGVEQFGIYTYVMQVITMISVIGFLGSDQYILKLIPQSAQIQINKLLNEQVSSIAVIVLVTSLLAILVLFAITKVSSVIPQIYLAQTGLGTLLVFPILIVFLQSALLRATQYIISSQILENIVNPIATLIALLLLEWWTNERNLTVSANEILITIIISYYITSFLGIYLLNQRVKIKLIFSFKFLNQTIKSLLPLCLLSILYQLFSRIPILAAGYFLSAKDVAQYFAASRIAEFIEFPLGIVAIVYVSKYSALNDFEQEKKQLMLLKSSIIVFTFALITYLTLLLFSVPIFNLFGEKMSDSYEVYVVLGFAYAIASATGIVDFALIRAGHAKMLNIAILISTVIMVIIMIIFPIKTPKDIAYIYGFSWVISKMLMVYFLWRKENLNIISFKILINKSI